MRRIRPEHARQAQRFARDEWDRDWYHEMKADGEAADAQEHDDLEREQQAPCDA